MAYFIISDKMSKKSDNDLGKFLLGLSAMVGGVFLIAEVVKIFGKEETVYKCPNCRKNVPYHVVNCPSCHVPLTWKI